MKVFPLPVKGPRMLLRHPVRKTCFVSSFDENRVVELAWPLPATVSDAPATILRQVSVVHPRGMVFARGKLFVASYGQPRGRLVCIDTENFKILFKVPAWRPRGLCLHKGKLYVTEVKRNQIAVYTLQGKRLGILPCGEPLRSPRGICMHKGLVVVADSGNHRLVAINPTPLVGGVVWTRTNLSKVNDVNSDGRRLLVSLWEEGVVDVTSSNHRWKLHNHMSRYVMMSVFQAKFYVAESVHAFVLEL